MGVVVVYIYDNLKLSTKHAYVSPLLEENLGLKVVTPKTGHLKCFQSNRDAFFFAHLKFQHDQIKPSLTALLFKM